MTDSVPIRRSEAITDPAYSFLAARVLAKDFDALTVIPTLSITQKVRLADEIKRLLSREGYVYFAQAQPSCLIKIGFSAQPWVRCRQLSRERPASIARDVVSILTDMPARFPDERKLHQRFAHLRQFGEWFRPGEDLLAYVRTVKAQQGGCS